MELTPFEKRHYIQLIDWIDSAQLNYLWGGPAYQYPLTLEQIEQHCMQDAVYPYLVTVNGESAGFIELFRVSNTEYRICRVFIAPQFRGLGLGQQLMGLVVDRARTQFEAKRLSLNVFSHNQSAIACYEKLGFETTSVDAGSREFEGRRWQLASMERAL